MLAGRLLSKRRVGGPSGHGLLLRDSESASTIQSLGCTPGATNKSGLIILDFGKPAYRSSDGVYGTINFDGSGVFVSNAKIQTMMEDFALGWWACAGLNLNVVIAQGVNNCASDTNDSNCGHLPSCDGTNVCNPNWATAGQNWANKTSGFSDYLNTQGFSSEEAPGAGIDAEPAYNPGYTFSQNFVDSYNSTTGCCLMYDFGAAYGGTWSNAAIYHVAYGASADVPVPEVYTGTNGPPPKSPQADEWAAVNQWATGTTPPHPAMYFYGVMCTSGSGYITCSSAYTAMLNDTTQSSIPYLTKIQFE